MSSTRLCSTAARLTASPISFFASALAGYRSLRTGTESRTCAAASSARRCTGLFVAVIKMVKAIVRITTARLTRFISVEFSAKPRAMRLCGEYFLPLLYDRPAPAYAKQIAPCSGDHDNHAQTDPVKKTQLILANVIGGDAIGVERHKAYTGHCIEKLAA